MHNIMEKIYLKKDIENIEKKINMLGKTTWDALGFINLRVFTTILFTLFLILLTSISYLLLPLLVILYYFSFYHILIIHPIRGCLKTSSIITASILALMFFITFAS